MKKLFSHENRMLVFNLKNLLRDAGIDSLVKNEFSGGAVGDLAPFDTWPELWVNDSDFARAQSVLQGIEQAGEGAPWYCSGCGEHNEASFEICWSCGRGNDRTE